jgi:2-polyprenyl-3-methyl-5-hydroxy-6-metoxy-1,4-benzoquinol methylase
MDIKTYYSFTTYKDVEDFKRLDFIVNTIKELNKPDLKILDIGCGNGNISLALGSLGYNVTGVDIDQTSIENARKLNTFKNVKFDLLDANAFNVKEEFDAIVCSEVLEHLDKPEDLVKSIFCILKKEGVLIATVPNGWGPREVIITKPMQWLHKNKMDSLMLKFKKALGYSNHTLQSSNPDLTHVQFFTARKFKNILENAGFKTLKWRNADFVERVFPYSFLTRRIYALQKLDCALADYIPKQFSSGFYTAWIKPN